MTAKREIILKRCVHSQTTEKQMNYGEAAELLSTTSKRATFNFRTFLRILFNDWYLTCPGDKLSARFSKRKSNRSCLIVRV